MANSKKHRQEKHGPEEEQDGHNRPTRFKEHKGYAHSRGKLDPSTRARFVPQVEKFKEEWRDPERTLDDLKSTWDLKFLKGEAKKLGIRQITLTIPYRVAFMVIGSQNLCILLHLYKKSKGKNETDFEVAVERARRISEGLK